MKVVCFEVVHKVLISRLTFVNSGFQSYRQAVVKPENMWVRKLTVCGTKEVSK